MKISFFIIVLFATFCLNQAYNLEINLRVGNKNEAPINGKISLFLKGAKLMKKLVFDKIEVKDREEIYKTNYFNEEVSDISIKWESDSKRPLFLDNLSIIFDYLKSVNFAMGKYIENGETQNYH